MFSQMQFSTESVANRQFSFVHSESRRAHRSEKNELDPSNRSHRELPSDNPSDNFESVMTKQKKADVDQPLQSDSESEKRDEEIVRNDLTHETNSLPAEELAIKPNLLGFEDPTLESAMEVLAPIGILTSGQSGKPTSIVEQLIGAKQASKQGTEEIANSEVALTESNELASAGQSLNQFLETRVGNASGLVSGLVSGSASGLKTIDNPAIDSSIDESKLTTNSGTAILETEDGLIPKSSTDVNSFEFVQGTTYRLTTDATTQTVAAPQPNSLTQSVINQVIETIVVDSVTASQLSHREMTLQINPPELGQLEIYIGTNEDSLKGLKAHIVASESLTSEMLSREKAHLVNALKEQGIDLPDVDISHRDPRDQDQQQFHSPERRAFRSSSAPEKTDMPRSIPRLNHSDSSGTSTVNVVV